mmetsp:Transcript_12195/g.49097  ORF Transcript_12195/g.49097 Transcript_12195/m.49097 type:complete len:270 (+) Transcript_12195:272-1081(+)
MRSRRPSLRRHGARCRRPGTRLLRRRRRRSRRQTRLLRPDPRRPPRPDNRRSGRSRHVRPRSVRASTTTAAWRFYVASLILPTRSRSRRPTSWLEFGSRSHPQQLHTQTAARRRRAGPNCRLTRSWLCTQKQSRRPRAAPNRRLIIAQREPPRRSVPIARRPSRTRWPRTRFPSRSFHLKLPASCKKNSRPRCKSTRGPSSTSPKKRNGPTMNATSRGCWVGGRFCQPRYGRKQSKSGGEKRRVLRASWLKAPFRASRRALSPRADTQI